MNLSELDTKILSILALNRFTVPQKSIFDELLPKWSDTGIYRRIRQLISRGFIVKGGSRSHPTLQITQEGVRADGLRCICDDETIHLDIRMGLLDCSETCGFSAALDKWHRMSFIAAHLSSEPRRREFFNCNEPCPERKIPGDGEVL